MLKPYLKFLDVYYGAKCNLACSHCDTRSDIVRGTEKDPSIQTMIEGIDLVFKHFDVDYLSLLGGEPLLYLDKLVPVLEHVKSKYSTPLLISTNGFVLDKKLDEFANIIKSYGINIFVCNHFSNFEDKTLACRVENSTIALVEKLGMSEGDERKFFSKFLDLQNSKNDPHFQRWIDKKSDNLLNSHSTDRYFTNGMTWLHYREQQDFKMNYRIVNLKPKPFASGDPELSYQLGCCSDICSFLYNKKLYKCGALGTLENFLEKHNSLDDPDWKKYLAYKPVDLKNATNEEIEDFSNTKFSSVSACDMCPASSNFSFVKTPNNVLPIKNV